ncbi:hypothetical protein SAMN05421790_101190 [Kroppenstedtia eburnea]|uniref:Uncharacterized protein n=1 Tax=Kroppenstedtia eburnea TaxID=714067 RepID=A0A1N7IPG4_9BACL|nr:hypothetical protein SAMN05421790_101190 [Kroppenstedtia eburnea]
MILPQKDLFRPYPLKRCDLVRLKAVGIGFHIPFRCSSEPKSFHVKPNPPCEWLFHNASRSVVIYAFMAGRDWVSHVVFVVLTIQNHSM